MAELTQKGFIFVFLFFLDAERKEEEESGSPKEIKQLLCSPAVSTRVFVCVF